LSPAVRYNRNNRVNLFREPNLLRAGPESGFDAQLEQLPLQPAVFLISAREGAPYLGRALSLRKRLLRLLGPRSEPSRRLYLRPVAERIEYWLTASHLESALLLWSLGRLHFPEEYARMLRLPRAAYVKLIRSSRFPRTQVTSRLTGGASLYYGPFRSRSSAEEFETALLDLFQIRRCPEDLDPAPGHPGCIYGEMLKCMRPCQMAVTEQEYAGEAARVAAFLSTAGRSLVEQSAAARDRLSQEMRFEEAARFHKRIEQIQHVQRQAGDLAREVTRLHGVAVTASVDPQAVALWFLRAGAFLAPRTFSVAPPTGRTATLDSRLRELVASLEAPLVSADIRHEHLGLLMRWYYSSWRDGEWLALEDYSNLPYRKLVNAIHRVATGSTAPAGL